MNDLVEGLLAHYLWEGCEAGLQTPLDGVIPLQRPVTRHDVDQHLAGRLSLCVQAVDTHDVARMVAFEVSLTDIDRGTTDTPLMSPREVWNSVSHPHRERLAIELRLLADHMMYEADKAFGVPTVVIYTGNGAMQVHAHTGPLPVQFAHDAAMTIASRALSKCRSTVRLGPKEVTTRPLPFETSFQGWLGTLLPIPLGVHPANKQRSFFVNTETGFDEIHPVDPLSQLKIVPAL